MSNTPIFFEFTTNREAYMALDTLEELGYRVSLHTEREMPMLHVMIDGDDLTSALEIAQAHGGRFIEAENSIDEASAFAMAYDPDGMIPIPAHLVNEDEMEDDEPDTSLSAFVNRSSGGYSSGHPQFDPSSDGYDGFDAGIHM